MNYYEQSFAAKQVKPIERLPLMLVAGCILFNFLLCFINTNFFTISASDIIFFEILLVFSSAICGFYKLDKPACFWLSILVLQFLFLFFLSFLKDEALLKPLRDVAIMPVFIALGMASKNININRFLYFLITFVFIVALAETFYTKDFLRYFNFKDYFVSKGGMEDHDWLVLDTFASGVRPQGRFLFDLPNVHRISSVFLEPVSLGFFAFICSLYAISVRAYISKKGYYYILILSFLLIWLSDARMALGCLIVMLVFKPIFKLLDQRLSILIFPLMFLVCYLINQYDLLDKDGEGIGARITFTMNLLDGINIENLFGILNFNHFTADSGVGNLIQNQGIIGLLLYWLPPLLFVKKTSPESRVYIYGLALYISIGFMISAAIYTIKTAALLWFLYGYVIANCSLNDRDVLVK